MITTNKIIALIVATGSGTRFGDTLPKQYQTLNGKSILRHTIERLLAHNKIDNVLVTINPDHAEYYKQATKGLNILPAVHGGLTRQQSVYNGLKSLQNYAPDIVLIHDAVRPNVQIELLDRAFESLNDYDGAIPGIPIMDTVKKVKDNTVIDTIPRDGLYRVQTPQIFHYDKIMTAHEQHKGLTLTDDAAIAERAGLSLAIVESNNWLMKITTQEDLLNMQSMMRATKETRIGQGFDVHRFEPGEHVTLCGERIPHTHKLKGHSDADVAMHALTDALYGAISNGDIGHHFPPSEDKWRGASSEIFLKHAHESLQKRGGRIINLDLTIICEAPKVGPHREQMRRNLANILAIDMDRISVKATTTEKLGFTGRSEGIAAQAIANVEITL
jgi:2-C-methyl-D-erythritol 4-phosphate cytidylyltransferase / 2-C-methyl-D-erythritol 2,4-cyclodiphosphate synthase